MELVSGVLLWLGDVLGIKWIRQEPNKLKKVAKVIIFLLVGVILVIIYFVLIS